jgi:ribonuclease HI
MKNTNPFDSALVNNSLVMNVESKITIFTDGSSRGNPGPGGYASVVVFPMPGGNPGSFNIVELGGREEHTTNNRMELQAAISAFSFISENLKTTNYKIITYSDSSYVINGITKWVFGWQKNNWLTAEKKPVENKDLWEKLFSLVNGLKVSWNKVGGHVGVVGNERCDEIATEFADGLTPPLYSGDLSEYEVKNILDISSNMLDESKRGHSKNHAKQKAFSYVSSVDGKIQIHKTWAECEARVKGKSKALYKKSISAEDEKNIIALWRK